MENNKRGGRREGSGRPPVRGEKGKTRAIRMTDADWALIRASAEARGLSIPLYLISLVEAANKK